MLRKIGIVLFLLAGSFFLYQKQMNPPKMTVEKVQQSLKPTIEPILKGYFDALGLTEYPKKLLLIALKEEKILQLWVAVDNQYIPAHSYPILAESGTIGPKLQEGDRQIPEGFYRIVGLNPNSRYHLSMELDYPNAFDREQAEKENRTNLGNEIFIHGNEVSIGCIAIGDRAIEELFYLVAKVGKENVSVSILPCDLRTKPLPAQEQRAWVLNLYRQLRNALPMYPVKEGNSK